MQDLGRLYAISTCLSRSNLCLPDVTGLHVGMSVRLLSCPFLLLWISDVSSAWASYRNFPEKDEGDKDFSSEQDSISSLHEGRHQSQVDIIFGGTDAPI